LFETPALAPASAPQVSSRDNFRIATPAIFICHLTSDANPWKVENKQKIIREDVMGTALSTTGVSRAAPGVRRGR